jgi:Ca-activated chloride channel family protein
MERLLGGAVDASITELGVQFQIATRLTSFVAVSETATVDPSDPTRQVQVTQDQPAHMNVSALGLSPAKPTFVASPALAGAPAPAPMARSRHPMPAAEETSFFGAPSEMEADLFEAEPVARSVAPKKTKRRQKSLLGRMMGALRKPRRAVIKATSTTTLGQDVGVTFAWRGGPWKLPRQITVHLTDGSTRQLEVDASRSTRDGRHDAGATLRLVLRDGASSFDAWSKIVVAGITVELN